MEVLMDQPTPAPTRKVSAAGIGGAVAIIGSWLLQTAAGVDVPPGVEAAFATLVATAAGYVVREG